MQGSGTDATATCGSSIYDYIHYSCQGTGREEGADITFSCLGELLAAVVFLNW